ncbi:hypothetical protein ABN034_20700 [Actinopolymorpha sp. B11F2]|uniref:hypothetical protein n=1 Tax=Actinopolymorpha sp. B11F2 TaxID=3160862 RepID=UPI0032E50C1C
MTDIRRLRDASGPAWSTFAGQSFMGRLDDGARHTHRFIGQIERLAALLDECADGLVHAQRLMKQSQELIIQYNLVVRDGWVHCPDEFDPESEPPHPDAPLTRRDIFEDRMSGFMQVQDLVDGLCVTIVGLIERLGTAEKEGWNDLYFTAGDFVVGETAELVRWFESQGVTEVGRRAASKVEWLGLASKYDDGSWQSTFYKQQAHSQDWAALSARNSVANWGLAARVLKVGGRLLTPIGITYSLYEGDPLDKAIFVNGVGLATGLVLAALVPGPGWVAVGVAAVGGYFVSQWADKEYDESQSARQKLLNSGPGLDPGPARIRGR